MALLQLSDSDNDSSLAASASSASSLSVQQAVQPVAGRLSQSAAERPVDYRLNFCQAESALVSVPEGELLTDIDPPDPPSTTTGHHQVAESNESDVLSESRSESNSTAVSASLSAGEKGVYFNNCSHANWCLINIVRFNLTCVQQNLVIYVELSLS